MPHVAHKTQSITEDWILKGVIQILINDANNLTTDEFVLKFARTLILQNIETGKHVLNHFGLSKTTDLDELYHILRTKPNNN